MAQARACGCAPAAACATRLAHLSGAYTELAQGCRDKADLVRLKKGLTARNTEIVPITPAISTRAAELIDALAQSQGLRLADALIGATAIDLQATLITANVKQFSAVEGLSFEALFTLT